MGILNKEKNWIEIITKILACIFFSLLIIIATLKTESEALTSCRKLKNDICSEVPIMINRECLYSVETETINNMTNNTNG